MLFQENLERAFAAAVHSTASGDTAATAAGRATTARGEAGVARDQATIAAAGATIARGTAAIAAARATARIQRNGPAWVYGVRLLPGLVFAVGATAEPTISSLGVLPGGVHSVAHAISADGAVVVGEGGGAFRWTGTQGMLSLGALPGGRESSSRGVSADGLVVAGYSDSSAGFRAFRWTVASGMMQDLGVLPGATGSTAEAISSDGVVVVGYSNPNGVQRAFRWTSTQGMQPLGTLPGGDESDARGINADGSVVVGTSGNPGASFRAFRWTSAAGSMQDIGTLPGDSYSAALATSADGVVVVGVSGNPLTYRAFRWTDGEGMQPLDTMPGSRGDGAHSVSADGRIVAGTYVHATGDRAFLWTCSLGIVDLNEYLPTLGVDLTGWILRSVNLSRDGSAMAGFGVHNGDARAWLIRGLPAFSHPVSRITCPTGSVSFHVTTAAWDLGPFTYQWQHEFPAGVWFDIDEGVNVNMATATGVATPTLHLADLGPIAPGAYRCVVSNACGVVTSNAATLTICIADTDDGTGTGACDGGVTIDDLLYYLGIFDQGLITADVDDGSFTGTPDGGVTIDDLLYYLARFDAGC